MIPIPCKNCTDREVGCHSKCESYIHFTSEKKKEREFNREKMHVLHDEQGRLYANLNGGCGKAVYE